MNEQKDKPLLSVPLLALRDRILHGFVKVLLAGQVAGSPFFSCSVAVRWLVVASHSPNNLGLGLPYLHPEEIKDWFA